MPPGGWLIVNTCKPIEEIKALTNREDIGYALVDATKLALEYLGRMFTNTIILGGLVKVAPFLFTLEQLGEAIGKTFKAKIAQQNIDVIKIAVDETVTYECGIEIDFTKDSRTDWTQVELNKIGAQELDLAGVWYVENINGGSRRTNTGSWGVSVADYHAEFCTQCGNCIFICPDFAIKREDQGGKWQVVGVDDFHCKGCGLCASVCPGKLDKATGEKSPALTMKMKC